jgi:hypothetical protein
MGTEPRPVQSKVKTQGSGRPARLKPSAMAKEPCEEDRRRPDSSSLSVKAIMQSCAPG